MQAEGFKRDDWNNQDHKWTQTCSQIVLEKRYYHSKKLDAQFYEDFTASIGTVKQPIVSVIILGTQEVLDEAKDSVAGRHIDHNLRFNEPNPLKERDEIVEKLLQFSKKQPLHHLVIVEPFPFNPNHPFYCPVRGFGVREQYYLNDEDHTPWADILSRTHGYSKFVPLPFQKDSICSPDSWFRKPNGELREDTHKKDEMSLTFWGMDLVLKKCLGFAKDFDNWLSPGRARVPRSLSPPPNVTPEKPDIIIWTSPRPAFRGYIQTLEEKVSRLNESKKADLQQIFLEIKQGRRINQEFISEFQKRTSKLTRPTLSVIMISDEEVMEIAKKLDEKYHNNKKGFYASSRSERFDEQRHKELEEAREKLSAYVETLPNQKFVIIGPLPLRCQACPLKAHTKRFKIFHDDAKSWYEMAIGFAVNYTENDFLYTEDVFNIARRFYCDPYHEKHRMHLNAKGVDMLLHQCLKSAKQFRDFLSYKNAGKADQKEYSSDSLSNIEQTTPSSDREKRQKEDLSDSLSRLCL